MFGQLSPAVSTGIGGHQHGRETGLPDSSLTLLRNRALDPVRTQGGFTQVWLVVQGPSGDRAF